MAVSGTWRRRQQRFVSPTRNPNLGAGVDAEHLNPVDHPDPFAEPTPALPAMPEFMYVQDDFLLPVTPPVHDPLPAEPAGHQVGGTPRGRGDLESRRASYRAHSADDGAARFNHFEQPITRGDRDTYTTQRAEMEFPQTGSRAALTRGRNAWPENNPDGPPAQGHYVNRWIDRQFTRRRISPDMSPLRPFTAGTATDIPAPTRGTPYTTPFAALAAARRLKLMTPQVRRVPRPPDDADLVDGTADPQYAAPVYWDEW